MGARNQESKNLKFYSLKAKVDKDIDPHFAITEKVDDKWQVTGKFNEMFGKITKVDIQEKVYDDVKSNIFRLYMEDENETSCIDLTHNAITYSILNTLSSEFDTSKEISIKVYKKSSEKDGKTYWNGRASLTVQGEKLGWGIEIADVPRPEQLFNGKGQPVLTNGKKTFDNSGVVAFWEDVFNTKIAPKFNTASPDPQPTSEGKPAESQKEDPKTTGKAENSSPTDEDDDLPF